MASSILLTKQRDFLAIFFAAGGVFVTFFATEKSKAQKEGIKGYREYGIEGEGVMQLLVLSVGYRAESR